MSVLKPAYRVFRSVVMTLIALLVVVYAGLYIALSVPGVQNRLRDKVSAELSSLFGGNLKIESLTVRPFSEVMLKGVTLYSPKGEKCTAIKKVAAGIDIWKLLGDRRIVLNYAEIIGLDADIVQQMKGGPTNIQFLIDALTPKDKNKPPATFDLKFRNVVVRDSKVAYRRPWMKGDDGETGRFADLRLDGLRMNLSVPTLSNNLYRFNLRNMQFDLSPGVSVRSLSAEVEYKKDSIGIDDRLTVKNLALSLPKTSLAVGDIEINPRNFNGIDAKISGSVTPSDFSALLPRLNAFDSLFDLNLDASMAGKQIVLNALDIKDSVSDSFVKLKGSVNDFIKTDALNLEISSLKADLAPNFISRILSMTDKLPERTVHIIDAAGRIRLDAEGSLTEGDIAQGRGSVGTDNGCVEFTSDVARIRSGNPSVKVSATGEDIDLGTFLSTDKIGRASFTLDAEMSGIDKNADGSVSVSAGELVVMGNKLADVEFELNKDGDDLSLLLEALSDEMELSADADVRLDGVSSILQAEARVLNLNPSKFGIKGDLSDSEISATFHVSTKGNSPDNITGNMRLLDLMVEKPDGKELYLPKLTVYIDSIGGADGSDYRFGRDIRVLSDWIDAKIKGDFTPTSIGKEMRDMLAAVVPTLMGRNGMENHGAWHEYTAADNDFDFDILIKGTQTPYDFFNCPVRPLADIPVKGKIDTRHGSIDLRLNTPHLLQGKDKLIRDVSLNIASDSFLGMAKLNAGLIYPAKKGDMQLVADVNAVQDKVNIDLGLNPSLDSKIKGGVFLTSSFSRISDAFHPKGELAVNVGIRPSAIIVGGTTWNIADGMIDYCGKRISVSNFLVSNGGEYLKIDGVASESPSDRLKVKLKDIDLEYIFNLLNINYVTFGGMATGEVSGSQLLTKTPQAHTEYLHVKDFSYNGAPLGDADLASEYDASEKKIGIYAVVSDRLTKERRVSVDGGIWVTRDSLSFNFDANKVNAALMRPFMSAFCNGLSGTASGKCKLYGGFQDVDLIGALRADTLNLNLGFTNTWYHAGGDSVFLRKGLIDIPALTLYDDEGHTAEFGGWLKHRYFHDPVFNFRLRDAKSLLCYNTNEKINPLWYGTIYGSGHAQINGVPGQIDIDINMTTEEGSRFVYVISDAEDVGQYSFLSFTDKKKESLKAAAPDSVPEYLKKYQKNIEDQSALSSNVILSLKGTVTNDALVTLIMDQSAGDNITARGQGALQMDYNMANEDLRMIGTYVLDEGNYNFTLQDIIIKNFNIRKGSVIKFDGDPMDANLDIAATYRVNTNLTDLDKSFSTDRELNRTNVPVDALLLVKGPLTNPDINFDVELPSLTSDVERKVKSIISTNDMMSRQIIYLLALNRFYTPEYTGASSNGSEWSSMASSTISSQLSNILSQMTDKLDVAPSFRSDKGDFTDLEFDLALSSRLLNNRLLINGNFGYRDRSTSNTQFVGDFDIEYLLSKNGNLRLKAYNHFNDQNYYLRSALTTQGVGVIFRKDFDRLFSRKPEPLGVNGVIEKNDSLSTVSVDTISNSALPTKL